jgi:hypothetical protein
MAKDQSLLHQEADMSRIKRFFAEPARTLFLALTLLALLPGVASAQFLAGGFGYGGWGYGGYGYPGYGFGGYGVSPYAFGYGYGYGYGYPAYGMAYGGIGYGYPGFGGFYPGYGYGYGTLYPNITAANVLGYSPGLPYAGPALSSPYTNPLFGVGLTPLGVQSYFAESNMLGRGQLAADRRTRARELLRYGR